MGLLEEAEPQPEVGEHLMCQLHLPSPSGGLEQPPQQAHEMPCLRLQQEANIESQSEETDSKQAAK
jgi:hypothetical protein